MHHTPLRSILIFGLLALVIFALPVGQASVAAQSANPTYLIIAPDQFTDELDDLVTLQQNRGFSVLLRLLSQTGSTTSEIKAAIQGIIPWPEYVLLVGDTSLIPGWDADHGVNPYTTTDYDYTTLDGDILPDTVLGRLPVHSQVELTAYITKLAAFSNRTTDPNWLQRMSFVSTDDLYFQSPIEKVFESISQKYTGPFGYTGTFTGRGGKMASTTGGDRLFPTTYNATREDVLSAINAGRAVVTYVGNGDQDSWAWNAGDWLTTSDIAALTGPPIPLVIGLSRSVPDPTPAGTMPTAWLLHPTSGALTNISPIADTEYLKSSDLAEFFFKAEFTAAVTPPTVGGALNAAFGEMGWKYPGQMLGIYETYQLFGDPSLSFHRQSGAFLAVPGTYFAVPYGMDVQIPVTVTNIGPTTETFSISLWSSMDLSTVEAAPNELTLASGESHTVFLTIHSFTDYDLHDTNTIRITASQDSNPLIQTVIQIKAQSFLPSVFMPLIRR